ncbi:MAG: hypothetical protein PHI68_01500 [Candidatus Cloacimonetes bacterium]|nr:hypothetical protein [Candidatus Cloacimonadota bacterium]
MFNPGRVVLSGFIFLLSASLLFAQNGNPGDEASAMIGSVAQELADNIPLNYPLILDIRAGEWTPPLGFELRRILLEKGADLREAISSGNYDNFSLADSLAEGNAVILICCWWSIWHG